MATENLAPFNTEAIDPEEARAIEIYEMQLGRVQAGQMPEEIFLEFRLRHGVYGQRDEGSQMIRVKIPFGGPKRRTAGNACGCCRRIFGQYHSHHDSPRCTVSLRGH